ncbi:hypothetical protein B0H17DRAFT_1146830 [Mycena rosella]|uniref:Uncharacterized protein n=1 Tax=Mycena rosella TaxID=1033263 RepID=A0AAD7CNS2_MYCRO|nr:hypothetical protein B0H17DRAFT_1146830 [Mycena rosella]
MYAAAALPPEVDADAEDLEVVLSALQVRLSGTQGCRPTKGLSSRTRRLLPNISCTLNFARTNAQPGPLYQATALDPANADLSQPKSPPPCSRVFHLSPSSSPGCLALTQDSSSTQDRKLGSARRASVPRIIVLCYGRVPPFDSDQAIGDDIFFCSSALSGRINPADALPNAATSSTCCAGSQNAPNDSLLLAILIELDRESVAHGAFQATLCFPIRARVGISAVQRTPTGNLEEGWLARGASLRSNELAYA